MNDLLHLPENTEDSSDLDDFEEDTEDENGHPKPKPEETPAWHNPDPKSLPWEKRPDESPRAFAAFVLYRDLGPKRSVLKAYRLQTGCEKAAVSGSWSHWRSKFHWYDRAQAFDDENERQLSGFSRDVEMRLSYMRLERQLFAQSAYAPLLEQLLGQIKDAIPSITFTDSVVPREGKPFVQRRTSLDQLARLLREVRDLETALHHGFPKNFSSGW